ncbi:MAG: caspase family protein [Gemmatimonadaceae bacterium]|jgi:hypothetical protein
MRKRALLIGINYVGQPSELAGCVDDIADMRRLCASLGYETRVLHDGAWPADDAAPAVPESPTRAAITAALGWLVAGAEADDRLFLHYSGHGGQLLSGAAASETDGLDETIAPVDYARAGMIRDDELRELLVDPLYESRATLRAVLDCCHSGTGVDLRYNLSAVHSAARSAAPTSAESRLNDLVEALVADKVHRELVAWFGEAAVAARLPARPAAASRDGFVEWTDGGDTQIFLSAAAVEQRRAGARTRAATPDVLVVSGCADDQTSADAAFGGRPNGALTFFLRAALERALGEKTWPLATDLLGDLRSRLAAAGFSQVPQLSSEIPVGGATRFDLS